jgi:triosephosphate isomerase
MITLTGRLGGLSVGFGTKSYFSERGIQAWLAEVLGASTASDVDKFIVPSFPSLATAMSIARKDFAVGAQDCSPFASGAHTGDVSAELLAEIGVSFVELGHAELRARGDSNNLIAKKVAEAHRWNLEVLLCVGEKDRGDAADAAKHCLRQIRESGADLDRTVIAYEPLWAIGGDESADRSHIVDTILRIKDGLAGSKSKVLYGGTAGPGLLGDIHQAADGLFLGRRAHNPQDYRYVVEEAQQLLGLTSGKGS